MKESNPREKYNECRKLQIIEGLHSSNNIHENKELTNANFILSTESVRGSNDLLFLSFQMLDNTKWNYIPNPIFFSLIKRQSNCSFSITLKAQMDTTGPFKVCIAVTCAHSNLKNIIMKLNLTYIIQKSSK